MRIKSLVYLFLISWYPRQQKQFKSSVIFLAKDILLLPALLVLSVLIEQFMHMPINSA